MFYYTGMRWGTSERMFAVVIPARGEIAWVCPKFEEERARELIKIGDDIRTWEEDESPYQRVAEIFRDRGMRTGRDRHGRARAVFSFRRHSQGRAGACSLSARLRSPPAVACSNRPPKSR